MYAGPTGKVETSSQRTITLESLLDAQAPKGSFQEHGCKRKASETDVFVLHPAPTSKQPRGQMSRVREACLELVAILLQQDVNGFFHFVPKKVKKGDCHASLCLRGLERLIHTNTIKTLKDLRDRVDELFQSYQRANVPLGPPSLDGSEAIATEASRLSSIAKRWFESFGNNSSLLHEPAGSPFASCDTDEVTALGLLNPDNKGLVSAKERVRTIGEEVGQLAYGTHLSPSGGYREDRRNRVIPYTYLNYGPFATFGPTFDSGASNCSPEANQLLLSTSWLPARMIYSLEVRGDSEKSHINECPWSKLRCVAEAEDDGELQAALSDCAAEWKEAQDSSEVLDEIIPSVIYGEHPDGDFGLYLANAITRNLPKVSGGVEMMELPTEAATITPEITALEDEDGPNEFSDSANTHLLAESARLLRDLYNAQHRRLSDFSAPALAEERNLRPCGREMQAATHLADNLVKIVGRLSQGPADILLSRTPVRRALGLDLQLHDAIADAVDIQSS